MPSRSNQQRREDSTKLVLDAALQLFVSKGYSLTSIQDIAEKAGVTKGLVYHYFSDKLSILLELLIRSEQSLFNPIFVQMRASTDDAEKQLSTFFSWIANVGGEHKELMLLPVLVSLEFHNTANPAEMQVSRLYQHLHTEVERVIKLGQAQNLFATDLIPSTMAIVVIAYVDGLLLQWYRWGDQLDGSGLAKVSREVMLRGILTDLSKTPAN